MEMLQLYVHNFHESKPYIELEFEGKDFDIKSHSMSLWGWLDFQCDEPQMELCVGVMCCLYENSDSDLVLFGISDLSVDAQCELYEILRRAVSFTNKLRMKK